MLSVTLKDLRKAGACIGGYNRLVCALKGVDFVERDMYIHYRHDKPIPLTYILKSNGLDDALWALCCVPNVDRDARLFAVWCARQVEQPEERCRNALDIAERHANGLASDDELFTARSAAWTAAWSASWEAARAAAWEATQSAAWKAAWSAAWEATRAVTQIAAWKATQTVTYEVALEAQKEMFVKMCEGSAPWQLDKSQEV